MHYDDGAFYRPLFENDMLQLQVARGCSHNRCKFCDMYHEPFRVSPIEEVEQDLDEVVASVPCVRRVFLTGGNALCLPYERLVGIMEAVRGRYPNASIGCFARVTDVARKTDEQLARLVELGLSDVSVGTESGLDEALEAMDKGFCVEESLRQCLRMEAAGLSYDLFYLLGMAGAGRVEDSALATARLYSQLAPNRIMVHTMTSFAGTRLAEMVENGDFTMAGELETVRELRRFVEEYEPRGRVYLLGNHYGNVAHACAWLPEQCDELLGYLDMVLQDADEEELRARRSRMLSI